jgi:tRNA(adenine34) deaminase
MNFMELALAEAEKAAGRGEVPIGAVLVDSEGSVLAVDSNRTIELHDPSAHAEILVMRRAGAKTRNYRLTGTTLYVTLEPCVMCAGAMIHARIDRLIFGASDPKAGGVLSCYQVGQDERLNHFFSVQSGVMAEECASLLQGFFQQRRKK